MIELVAVGLIVLAVALAAWQLRRIRKRQQAAYRDTFSPDGRVMIRMSEEEWERAGARYGMAQQAARAGFFYNHILTCPLLPEECETCQELIREGEARVEEEGKEEEGEHDRQA